MPLTLLLVGLAVLVGFVRGGRLGRIAAAGLQASWLLFAGLVVQLGVDASAARGFLEGRAGYALLLVSQLLVLAWVVVNRYRPGMPLVFLGLALNAIVIGLNGAMPVDPEAIRALGIGDAAVPPGKHTLMTPGTRLPLLADIWPLPPLRTVVSIGDVVLGAGLIPLVHHLMTYRSPVERRGGPRTT